jgi:RND family efflux transporter MFP subunit
MFIREELNRNRSVLFALPALLACACLAGDASAFQGDIVARGGGEREVIVKREAIQVIDQREYKAALHLDPIRKVDLVAPSDGTVLTLLVKPGQKVKPQTEAARMDDSRAALLLKRARAELQAMTLEEKIAQSKGDADLAAAATARVEAAKADVELAEQGIDRLVVRAPFSGEVVSVHVADGQFVRAGDKLATVIDPSQLQVEVPVERSTVSVGGALDIKVEDLSVKGKVEAVLPLSPRFDPLRELAASPCSALVTVDNSAGKLSAGQSVFPQLIPQAPVAVVSSAAVANLPDGNRKVQVLRDNVVRDVPVGILAKVGIDRVYVSGWFGSGDEVIVGASRELADGTPLRALAAGRPEPSADVPAAGANVGAAGSAPAAAGAKKPAATGF